MQSRKPEGRRQRCETGWRPSLPARRPATESATNCGPLTRPIAATRICREATDFIFTMMAEEWGMVGGVALLGLYALIIIWGYALSLRCRSQFGRLVGLGLTTTFFLYVFINIAMVMGLVPVVGVPLPLISYGGTAMLTLLFGFGLILSAYIHRDVPIGRHGPEIG